MTVISLSVKVPVSSLEVKVIVTAASWVPLSATSPEDSAIVGGVVSDGTEQVVRSLLRTPSLIQALATPGWPSFVYDTGVIDEPLYAKVYDPHPLPKRDSFVTRPEVSRLSEAQLVSFNPEPSGVSLYKRTAEVHL